MKKILATVLSLVVVLTLFTVCFSASAAFTVADIESNVRVCPGAPLPLEAPEIFGDEPFAQGWEIKYSETGSWVAYDGSALPEHNTAADREGTVWVRYFVTDMSGDARVETNECEVTLAHVPQGKFETSMLEHWKICADCGAKCDVEAHTSLADSGTNGETCSVCGNQRRYGFTFVMNFWNWLLNLIMSFI